MDQTLCRSGRSHFFCYDKSRNGKIFPFASVKKFCHLRGKFNCNQFMEMCFTDPPVHRSIKQFDWICRIQIAKKINIFSHLEMGIFWHFDFCHNRRNGFWSYLWRRPCVPSCFFQTQFEVCDPPRSTLTSGRVVSRLTFCIDQLFHETSIK